MKFYVSRTSLYYGDGQPCKEAIPLTEEEKDNYGLYKWGIEIKTLDELLKFLRKYKGLLIRYKDTDEMYHNIQIVDDYLG